MHCATAPQIAEIQRGKRWPLHKHQEIFGSSQPRSPGRRIGAESVLRGFLQPALPNHRWRSLGPAAIGCDDCDLRVSCTAIGSNHFPRRDCKGTATLFLEPKEAGYQTMPRGSTKHGRSCKWDTLVAYEFRGVVRTSGHPFERLSRVRAPL